MPQRKTARLPGMQRRLSRSAHPARKAALSWRALEFVVQHFSRLLNMLNKHYCWTSAYPNDKRALL